MKKTIRSVVIDSLACPRCGKDIIEPKPGRLLCSKCGHVIQTRDGKPVFTPVPAGMMAAPKLVRGREEGSEWRKANWRFLEEFVAGLPARSLILDFGAGHGDFSEILAQRTCIALDVFPYAEVDIVCDMQKVVPFKKGEFDAIVLMNVLEHIQNPQELLSTLSTLLKPTGRLVVTVPFLLKLHQLPYDFARYSHIQLREMAKVAGLEVVTLEGYYDPMTLYFESQNNLRNHVLSERSPFQRKMARLIMMGISCLLRWLKLFAGEGTAGDPWGWSSPYPIGYQAIFKLHKGRQR